MKKLMAITPSILQPLMDLPKWSTVLLEAGADIEQPGRDGLHPLHNAVTLGHTDIVALLHPERGGG